MPVTVKVTLTEASPTKNDLRPRAKVNSTAKPLRDAPTRPPPTRYSPSPSVRIKSKVTPTLARYTPRSPPQPLRPTHSPSTSSVSFSSRSSVSATRSSDDDNLRNTLTNLLQLSTHTNDQETDDERSEQQNLKAEAKSNRKIADLEITNRSLLAINASLESTKHKQSKEIRDLRRKLRESRLVLPPRAFRAVSDSASTSTSTDDSDESDDDDEEEEEEAKDETYARIKAMMENLLDVGRRALETQPRDFVEGAKKVLSPDELRDDDDEDDEDEEDKDPATVRGSGSGSVDSEDEVERTLVDMTPSPPPIRAMYR